MRFKRARLLLMAMFLAIASTALASTTWYVNGVSGSDNNNCISSQIACKTIGHAISLASSGDSIMVAAATYTENLTIGLSLKILGSGSTTTIIDGGGYCTVVIIPKSGTQVTLSKVTIRNGNGGNGGGIYNSGVLRVIDTILSGNLARYYGGGIYNSGTLIVRDSTLSGNTVSNTCHSICPAFGGGIYNIGALTINKTTLSKNLASATDRHSAGGGIFNGGTLAINNSTLTGNSTTGIGGSIYTYSEGTAILQNTIVANSPSGGNCGGSVTSNGYNLSSDTTCNFNSTGDLNNTDPKIGQLGYLWRTDTDYPFALWKSGD